jgi:hypothetical protein
MKTASARSLRRLPQVVALALCMTFALSAHAQQATNAAASQKDTSQQLLQRINELEAKVKQLEEKQAAPAAVPEPVAEGPTVHDRDYLTFSDHGNHAERISVIHVAYVNSTYEFLNEAMLLNNTNIGLPSSNSLGAYSQVSRKFGAHRPYFRYAYMNLSPGDQIYSDPTEGQVVTRRNGPSLGLRYDFTEHTAFKLPYDRLAQRDLPTSNGIATQFAFTF